MSALKRVMLAGLAACVVPFLAGCTKTSDGSIEFRRQNMMGGPFSPGTGAVVDPASLVFPPPPVPAQPMEQVSVKKKSPAGTVRRGRPAAPAAIATPVEAEPAANLNCRNATQTGGRVKFVCR